MTGDESVDGHTRGVAAQVLNTVDPSESVRLLLRSFFAQTEEGRIWEGAMALEVLSHHAALRPLARALQDSNVQRRQAAAHVLGSSAGSGRREAAALAAALLDRTQPLAVREQCAESLAYVGQRGALPALIAALEDEEPGMRFWAVFALGSLGRDLDPVARVSMVVPALERMLADDAIAPGWWSVSAEALAMLADLDDGRRGVLAAELRRVQTDPNASPEERRWAETYGDTRPGQ